MLERFKKVFEELKKQRIIRNQQEFVELIGYNKSTVSQILNGKYELTDRFLFSVCNTFPMINSSYIRYGIGEMLQAKSENELTGVGECKECEKLKKEISMLEQLIESKNETIRAYQSKEKNNGSSKGRHSA